MLGGRPAFSPVVSEKTAILALLFAANAFFTFLGLELLFIGYKSCGAGSGARRLHALPVISRRSCRDLYR
jgi:hypothetical protein